MQLSRRDRWAGVIILLFVAALTIPFLLAQSSSNEHSVFAGFLFNPVDGYSYLAKMRQGFDGSWLFHLPFTAQPGEGTPLYLLYIALGHAARVLGWSLIFTLHAFRIGAAALLGVVVYRFLCRVLPDSPWRLFALALALFGSGLGWLASTWGWFTSDLWVAEGYPFMSSFANVHFPLGLSIQIWLLTPWKQEEPGWRGFAANWLVAALLSVVNPFAWAVVIPVQATWIVWRSWRKQRRQSEAARWAGAFLGGLPYAAYSVLLVNTHPELIQSNLQNVAPTPSALDLALAFSPALLAAAAGLYLALRRRESDEIRLALVWLVVCALIVWLPVNFQRRLLSGYFVPVAALAAYAFQQKALPVFRRRWMAPLLFLLSLPSLLIIVLGGLSVARNHDPALSTYTQELRAFAWLDEHAAGGSLVLAAPQTSLRLPAYTSSRVMYAHPFETVDADLRQAEVLEFFTGRMAPADLANYLHIWHVDYILYGPREQALGVMPALPGWRVVYQADETQLWAPESPDG